MMCLLYVATNMFSALVCVVLQMRIAHQYDMVCEVVGEDRKVRLRIMPA